jgi:8-oxo-dGTP diphosphatase
MPVDDQGSFEDRYKLIPRVLIFVTRGESILLLKGSPNKRLWANLYNGIGGHVEKGEDIHSAALREFYEETGLDLIDPWLCAVAAIDTDKQIGIGMFVFRGGISPGEPKSSSEGTLEWIPIKKIKALPLVEDLPVLVPMIMEIRKTDPPLFLHYFYDDKIKLVIRSGNKVHLSSN